MVSSVCYGMITLPLFPPPFLLMMDDLNQKQIVNKTRSSSQIHDRQLVVHLTHQPATII